MRFRFSRCAVTILILTLAGCGDDGGGDDAGAGDAGAASDAGAMADAGAAADAGSSSDAGGAADAGGGGSCPTATLPSQASVSYDGSTRGGPNLFESNRLEWGPAGDDALLFVVPETGTYAFAMNDGLTDNDGCAISIRNGGASSALHSVAETCPAGAGPRQLPDAFFIAGEGFTDTVDLTGGTELLVLVSCAVWSSPVTEVDYTLTITRQ